MEYPEPAQRESLTSHLNQVQASLSVSTGREGKRYFHLRLSSVCAWAQALISQAWWGTWVTWIKKTTWVISHNINWGFRSVGAHLCPCVICKWSTTFYCPFGSLSSSPEPCISHILNILSEAQNNILGTGNLREAHCGHRLAEHRASV